LYIITLSHKLVAVDGVMYYGTISGSLERIFHGYSGQKLYHNTIEKAGALLYAIVHGHSFSDGNKRTGLLTTYLFLMYNGFNLFVPKDTTGFLEKMADALNPSAPTEQDAIDWVRKNTTKSVLYLLTCTFLTYYCRFRGTGFLEAVTRTVLEENLFPVGLDKEKLTDHTLGKGTEPLIKCDTE
jgi:death-on-curing family protein